MNKIVTIKKSYKDKILELNPHLLFLPLLIFYIVIILIFSKNLVGDGPRYIQFANNLLIGFYSPPMPNINFWNGPGYPIILVPFVGLELPFIFPKLLNGVFLYFSAVFFYKTFQLYIKNKSKIILYSVIIFGFYYLPFQYLPRLVTEIFTIFLISGFSYSFCYLYQKNNLKSCNLVIPVLFLSYLALTKIIFGYVILLGFVMSLILLLIKQKPKIKIFMLVNLFALLLCTPYLIYTYSLTNKFFYWGNSGGESLYWMSTPYEDECGSFGLYPMNGLYNEKDIIKIKESHHIKFFKKISGMTPVEKDEALRKKAISNIIKHPKKYFMNWLSNIGRMVFSYPFSHTRQTIKTYFTILPNMFVFVLTILFLFPTIKFRKKVPIEIRLLLIFIFIYLLCSSLLSAYRRQFYVTIPVIGLWLGYMISKLIIINHNFGDKM